MTRKNRKIVTLIVTHSPAHYDEVLRIVIQLLFGNADIDLSKVEFHLTIDGGRSITPKMRQMERAGRAMLVGVSGGKSRDDEHGTGFGSAAAMPVDGLRENFARVCTENGLSDESFIAEAWDRFEHRIAYADIRDSTPTGRPLDLAGLIKSWGYTRLFRRDEDAVDVELGQFTEVDLRTMIDWVRILLVGWVLMPNERPSDDEAEALNSMLTGWVLRHIGWRTKPRDGGPHTLEGLLKTIQRKGGEDGVNEAVTYRRLKSLCDHWRQICCGPAKPWQQELKFRKLLRNDPQFDGERPECPETFANMLLQIYRREHMGRSAFMGTLPRAVRDALALPEGATRLFLSTLLGAWHDDQWLFHIHAAHEARRPDVVERWSPHEGAHSTLAIISAKGPHTATQVRLNRRVKTGLMLVRNALLDTHLLALNVDGVGAEAMRNGITVERFRDRVMRHAVALLRMHELHAAGIAIPWKTARHPADILFADGQLPAEIIDPAAWYAATDEDGHVHSVMNGSLAHSDVPKTRLSRQELREIAQVVQTAIASDDVTRAFRAEFARLAELWRSQP